MPCHVCPGVPLRPRLCVCCATSLHRLSYHCSTRLIPLLPLLSYSVPSYSSVMITVPLLSVLTTYFGASAATLHMLHLSAYLGFAGSSSTSGGAGSHGNLLSGDLSALCLCAAMSADACRNRVFLSLPSLLVGSLVEADYQYLSSRRSLSGRLTG